MKKFFKEIYFSIKHYCKTTDMFLLLISISASFLSFPLIFSLYPNKIKTLRPFYIQIASSIIGVVCAVIISTIDYHKLKKIIKPLCIITVFLNLIPFTPLGKTRGDDLLTSAGSGSANLNWINLGFTKIQPSEFLKVMFILSFSYHCSQVIKEINKPKVLAKLFLHALIPIGIIYAQKDYGTMSVFLFIAFCIVLSANTNWKVVLAMGMCGAVILILFLTKKLPSYLMKRFYVLKNLEAERLGLGFQQYHGRITLATGKIFGKGFFSKNMLYTPQEMHNDMIFSHIGQIFGFVGCVCVLIWVVIYCIRILQIGKNSKDNLGCLISVGVFALIFFQSAINIGMVLVLTPVIGISMPFISSGGTFVLATYISLGILLSVHKNSYKPTLF